MPEQPLAHRLYRSLNKPLTILGVERKLFMLAAFMSAATFNMFGSLVSLGRWATRTDPQILRILLNSSRQKTHYDPFKHASPTAQLWNRSIRR
jgi:type IV secretory pathway TrbD component